MPAVQACNDAFQLRLWRKERTTVVSKYRRDIRLCATLLKFKFIFILKIHTKQIQAFYDNQTHVIPSRVWTVLCEIPEMQKYSKYIQNKCQEHTVVSYNLSCTKSQTYHYIHLHTVQYIIICYCGVTLSCCYSYYSINTF